MRDQRGAALVEFAIIAPVLLMVLCGVFDLGYHLYGNTQIEGAINKAARDSALEGSEPATIDARVDDAVRDIVPAAELRSRAASIRTFARSPGRKTSPTSTVTAHATKASRSKTPMATAIGTSIAHAAARAARAMRCCTQ